MFSIRQSDKDYKELKRLEKKQIKVKYKTGRAPRKTMEWMMEQPNHEKNFFKNKKKDWRINTRNWDCAIVAIKNAKLDIGDKANLKQGQVGIEPFYGIVDEKKYFSAIKKIKGVKKVKKRNNISPKELGEWLKDKKHTAIINVSTKTRNLPIRMGR